MVITWFCDTMSLRQFWGILWKLNVPAKVKIFCWRAMHGILPLKSILAGRHIGTSGQCPLCSLHAEDILHMMFGCQGATSIWRGLGLENLVNHVMRVIRVQHATVGNPKRKV
jgi:hypothetical protein